MEFFNSVSVNILTGLIGGSIATFIITVYFYSKTKILGNALAKGYFINFISPKVKDVDVIEISVYVIKSLQEINSSLEILESKAHIKKVNRDLVEDLPRGKIYHDVPTTLRSVKEYIEEKKLKEAKICKCFFNALQKEVESHKLNGNGDVQNFRKVIFKTL